MRDLEIERSCVGTTNVAEFLMRRQFPFLSWLGCAVAITFPLCASEVNLAHDLPYKEGPALMSEENVRCVLDLYLPAVRKNFPSLVWLHGGGFTGGSKSTAISQGFARRLAETGIAVAMVEYRLSPTVKFPAYVEDAAAAFGWVRRHIADHGGDPARVFLGGHSAGAYQALMVALDNRYLAANELDEKAIAGLIAISGQTTTHFTVRAERGLGERIVVDDAAPLFHVQPRPFPFLLFAASDDMPMRVEEMHLLAVALRGAKNEHVTDRVWPDRNHGSVFSDMAKPDDPVAAAIIAFIRSSAPETPPLARP